MASSTMPYLSQLSFIRFMLIEVPAAVGRPLADLGGEVFGTMTQVEFQIRFPRDVGAAASGHVVVVTAHMHQRIFPGSRCGICRKGRDRTRNTSADHAAGKRFAEISSFHM